MAARAKQDTASSAGAGVQAYSVSERTVGTLAHDSSALASSTLHLANVLQSTLDLRGLLELFAQEMNHVVPHDGMSYVNEEERIGVLRGEDAAHQCTYNLLVLDKSLGQLTFKRKSPFTPPETDQIEALVCALVYPLRNAILYKHAVDTAFKDPVTGINNRAALDATVDREVTLAQRHGNALSALMLDLDHFKRVNDSYGHLAGDRVLRAIAGRLIDCTRGGDVVYRYGGEEFVAILSNTDSGGACLLAERIRQAVESAEIRFEDISIPITVSIGVATLTREDSAASLLAKADQALYSAKAGGRNRIVWHENGPPRDVSLEI